MARVAKKYNVENLMTFNATVTVLEWLEDRKKWKVGIEVEGKMRWDEADFVINGCGFLNRPKNPWVASEAGRTYGFV
jgi:cation diffusion facilitator CzcD-associated flavoprotein CzcO